MTLTNLKRYRSVIEVHRVEVGKTAFICYTIWVGMVESRKQEKT